MRTLNTMLVERATAKHEMPSDPLELPRRLATEMLGAPVLDAALFFRQSSDVAGRLAESTTFGGPLARLALKKYEQSRAGGLPEHFLLAVTADEVVALERKMGMRSSATLGTPGAEVARWRRVDLTVSVEEKDWRLYVTLESPSEDESVKCAIGKITATEDFVALLADPSRQTPAEQFPAS